MVKDQRSEVRVGSEEAGCKETKDRTKETEDRTNQ
jgi:hypothetical protein